MTAAVTAGAEQRPLKKEAVWTFSAAHLMNDLMTVGIVPALLPLYKSTYGLTYTQTGLIVLFSYMMSSVMQPVFGWMTDRHPQVWFLPFGVLLSCCGLALTGLAPSFVWVLVFISLSGLGSGAFHPEASRGTHLAAGKAKGMAQAIFQVGGNGGQALGPLMLPLFVLATGLHGLTVFFVLALAGFYATWRILPWYRMRIDEDRRTKRTLAGRNRLWALTLFVSVIILRSWCQIGVSGFLPFFYLHQHISLSHADLLTFLFLAAGAVGTFLGGTLSDWLGKRILLTISLLISVPFAYFLPHVHGFLAAVVLFLFGFTVLSSSAVSVVYAQMLLPKNIAMASGLTIGFGVGAGGIGATLFGRLSDLYGVNLVLDLIVLLPLLAGLISLLLPSDQSLAPREA